MEKGGETSDRQLEATIVLDELRVLSVGRLPDNDGGNLGATMLTVKKPSMDKGAATSDLQLEVPIVLRELRSLSEGRLPDKDAGNLGATLLAVKKTLYGEGSSNVAAPIGSLHCHG